jgi:hypothetical protein
MSARRSAALFVAFGIAFKPAVNDDILVLRSPDLGLAWQARGKT